MEKDAVEPEGLAQPLLEAICEPRHDLRLQTIVRGFRQAVSAKRNDWALLFRGYEHLLRGQHDLVDETFARFLEFLPGAPGDAEKPDAFRHLQDLLYAHVERKKAERYAYGIGHQHSPGDKGRMRRRAMAHISKARAKYREVEARALGYRQIAVAIHHGLGNTAMLAGDIALFCADKPPRKWPKYYGIAKKHYLDAIGVGGTGSLLSAPSHRRLAELCVRHDTFLRGRRKARQRQDMTECLQHVMASPKTLREGFAPLLVLQAIAGYWLAGTGPEPASRNETRKRREDTQKLLQSAVNADPFDRDVRRNIESLADTVRRDEAERDEKDSGFSRRVRLLAPSKASQTNQKSYFEEDRSLSIREGRNTLLVLRRWSSYTPILAVEQHETVGGGFLVQWNGKFVAVDPGIGFLRNMHLYGYNACHLDAVIVTHQHLDHTGDIEGILAVMKELKKVTEDEEKERKKAGKGAGQRPSMNGGGGKKIFFVLNRSGIERWEDLKLPASGALAEEFVCLCARSGRYEIPGASMSVEPCPVNSHIDAVDESKCRAETGMGVILHLKRNNGTSYRLGFTSDTGYLSGDGTWIDRHYRECDGLVVNLSTVCDLGKLGTSGVKSPERSKWSSPDGKLYKKHMGFWGTARFIRELAAAKCPNRVILVSEFGEEMAGLRVQVQDELQALIKSTGEDGKLQAARIFAVDVGARLDLDTNELRCQFGHNACNEPATHTIEIPVERAGRAASALGRTDHWLLQLCKKHYDFAKTKMLWERFGGLGV